MSVDRKLLPQIPSKEIVNYSLFLTDRGIDNRPKVVPTDTLKPIQKTVDIDKIEQMMDDYNKIARIPIIIDKDGDILDGHHRWLALQKLGVPNVIVLYCDCSLEELITASYEFDKAEFKSVKEDRAEYGYDLGRDDFVESVGQPLLVRKRLAFVDDNLDDYYNYSKYYNFGKYDSNYGKYNE